MSPRPGGSLAMGCDLTNWKFLTEAMAALPLKSTRQDDNASYLTDGPVGTRMNGLNAETVSDSTNYLLTRSWKTITLCLYISFCLPSARIFSKGPTRSTRIFLEAAPSATGGGATTRDGWGMHTSIPLSLPSQGRRFELK